MSRVAWTILVPFCLLLAVLAVVTIVRENSAGAETDTPAKSGVVDMANIKFAPTTLIGLSSARSVIPSAALPTSHSFTGRVPSALMVSHV